jgi:cytochrome c oxidase subunit 2
MSFCPAVLASLYEPLRAASSLAPQVNRIFWTLFVVSAVLVILLAALNLAFLIRYRRGSRARRGPLRIATWKIETAWIAGTTVAFCGIFAWGASIYLEEKRVPRDATAIDVVARQWMWDIRQPNGRREFNTLHIPLHRPIVLRLASEDVIHSFFVPAFRIKQDVVPGKTVMVWFEASTAGRFHIFCSQFCGTAHAAMIGEVIAQSPDEYSAWLAQAVRDGDPNAHGAQLFARYGCNGCHGPDAIVRAPALEGLYGKRVTLADGSSVMADDQYIRAAILEPASQVVAGYPSVMPSFKGVIPENDLIELLAYLRSLGSATAPASSAR